MEAKVEAAKAAVKEAFAAFVAASSKAAEIGRASEAAQQELESVRKRLAEARKTYFTANDELMRSIG